MPRKRKKSTLARKPSLVFTESPVNVQKNVPSPVLCARHPPTASSVPVEELHDLHWVSPQFRNVRHSGGLGKHRLTRQRRHSVAGHSLGNKENFHNGVPSGLSKFKSLKFIGDQTAVPSIVEDVEVTIDTDTETDDDGENCAGCNYEINDKDSQCGGYTKNSKGITILGGPKKNSGRLHLGIPGSPRNQQENCVRNSGETNENDTEAVTLERIDLDFSGNNFDENQSVNGTQRRNSMKQKPPIKRLFESQLPSNHGRAGSDFREDFDDVKTEISDQCETAPDSDTELLNSPSVRRSARIRKLQKMLENPDSPRSGRTLTCSLRKTVLAPNTPENEYGWSKRKRQLITYIKKKS